MKKIVAMLLLGMSLQAYADNEGAAMCQSMGEFSEAALVSRVDGLPRKEALQLVDEVAADVDASVKDSITELMKSIVSSVYEVDLSVLKQDPRAITDLGQYLNSSINESCLKSLGN